MKLLAIAWKDLLRSFRSFMFIFFGFGAPLLMGGIFFVAFGGLGSADGGFELPTTEVQLVNLDVADPRYGGVSAGGMLAEFLQSEQLASLVHVVEASDAQSARAAVDGQRAGVAVIIPAGFTAAAFGGESPAAVELYEDPTLTVGPSVVRAIVRQFVDGFAGSLIAMEVAAGQLQAHGLTVDAATQQGIALAYADWARRSGEGQQDPANVLVEIRPPAGEKPADGVVTPVALITGGMLVFFVFYTGAASALDILLEEEGGTLPRIFTTPTPLSAILGGKVLAILASLVVQVAVLMLVSALIYGIDWGTPLPAGVVALALVVLSATFGILVASLLKNTRQTGIIYGGVLTVAGMLGMSPIFTAAQSGASKTMGTVSLAVPQGWGVRGIKLLLEGGGLIDVLPTVVVMLALSVAFFAVGLWRFHRRFA